MKKKNAVFICEVSEAHVKVIKWISSGAGQGKCADLEMMSVDPGADEQALISELSRLLQKLDYRKHPLIISLPRHQVACRYLRVPSQAPKEIERIISLQAPRYLPYPTQELITGYQIIFTDKDGYTGLNLVIAHQEIIQRCLRIIQALEAQQVTITLSSYGLCSFYSCINPAEAGTVMIVDVDAQGVELAIVWQRKLLFSRYFKLDPLSTGWENLFIDEINRTTEAYLKELDREAPRKIVFLGAPKTAQRFAQALKGRMQLPLETTTSYEQIPLATDLFPTILNSDCALASVLGLALERLPESLNLLPAEIKQKARQRARKKETLQLGLLILGTILLLTLGIARHLENQVHYLKQLEGQLHQLAPQGQSLEEMERRLQLWEDRLGKRPLGFELLHELYRLLPDQMALAYFGYEESGKIVLRGTSQDLNSVFATVARLEKSLLFKNFAIKVKYATKRKTATGEVVDFEIICQKY